MYVGAKGVDRDTCGWAVLPCATVNFAHVHRAVDWAASVTLQPDTHSPEQSVVTFVLTSDYTLSGEQSSDGANPVKMVSTLADGEAEAAFVIQKSTAASSQSPTSILPLLPVK